jgi:hypothetical protein
MHIQVIPWRHKELIVLHTNEKFKALLAPIAAIKSDLQGLSEGGGAEGAICLGPTV